MVSVMVMVVIEAVTVSFSRQFNTSLQFPGGEGTSVEDLLPSEWTMVMP